VLPSRQAQFDKRTVRPGDSCFDRIWSADRKFDFVSLVIGSKADGLLTRNPTLVLTEREGVYWDLWLQRWKLKVLG